MVLSASFVTLGATAPAGADSSSKSIPAAVTLLKQYENRPQHIQVTKDVGKAIPTGKTLDWVVCGSPLCTVLTPALSSAAAALGWKVVAIPGGLTPETILDAWNQAVANHPDAVMGSGFPAAVFQP